MKEMKRLVSMVLCLVMILSLLPVGAVRAHAAETIVTGNVVDAMVVMSDVHINTNSNQTKTKKQLVQNVMNAIKADFPNVSTVNSAGDMFSSNEGTMSGNASTVTDWVDDVFNVPVHYVWSDHDRAATDISKESRLVYGTGSSENYYVYLLSMADLSSWDRYNAGFYSKNEITKHIAAFETTAAGLDKSKPLFIVGHQPLSDDRGDNGYAYEWVTAINKVAETMDVAYFFGHNHKYDDNQKSYYYAKGETMPVPTTKVLSGSGYSTDLESKNVKLNFTHINAGYMNPETTSSSTQTNARLGTALAVVISENAIRYVTYNKNGKYTNSFAVDETVNRDHKLTSISVEAPAKVEYALGEELDLTGMTVTATYGSTKKVAVTEGYTLSDVDMTVAGEQTVTVTFGGKTASFTIKVIAPEVADPTLVSIAITQLPKTEYAWGEDLDLTGMEVTATFSDGSTRVVEGWTVDETNMFEAGTKKLGVCYSVGELTAWAEFEIVVGEAPTEEPTEEPTEAPEIKEDTFFSDDEFAAVTATATGATLAEVLENAKADELLEYWYGYDISLEGQVADTSVTVKLWLDPDAMTSENLAVYFVNANGELEAVTGYAVAVDEENVEYITISDAALGTYIYGTPKVIESEGAKLVSLKLTPPTKTAYFDSDVQDKPVMVIAENGEQEEIVEKVIYLDITGLEVIAVYDDGTEKEIQWNEFVDSADGYSLTFDALVVDGQVQYGKKTVTVTYVDGKETATATFTVNVCRESITVEEVTIKFDTPSVESLTVEIPETVDEVIANAVMEVIDGDVTVYDIKPVYAEGFDKLEGTATVTLPLPEGLTNPVVYYVSDDGATIEKMDAQVVDGKLVFTTDHFSKYVVGEDGTVDSGAEDKVVTKDVYVLVKKIAAEGDYLLVNANSGNDAILLKATDRGVGAVTDIQVKTATTKDNKEITYIDVPSDAAAIWNAAGGKNKYKLYNAATDRYLRRSSSSLTVTDASDSATSWTTSEDNAVYYDGSTDRYIRYNSGWQTLNSGSGTVYIYQKQQVTITEHQEAGTYSIEGSATPATAPNLSGLGITLDSTVYFTSTNSKVELTPSENGTYSYMFVDSEGNEITENTIGTITMNADGKSATLDPNGHVGTATVRAIYSWTEEGEPYQLYNDFTVTTEKHDYALTIVEVKDGTADTTELKNLVIKGVDNSTTKVVTANVTMDGQAINPAVKWIIDGDTTGIFDPDAGLTLNGVSGNEVAGAGNVTLNFSGIGGMATIRAILSDGTSKAFDVAVSKTAYYVPEDGTNDFPDYPNPGAVVIDKTATPVGDFNQTGTAMIELNMFGIPAGSGVDVIVMLDMSSSMNRCIMHDANNCTNRQCDKVTRLAALKNSLLDFETILDNSGNKDIRVAIADFNGFYSSGAVARDDADTMNDNKSLANDTTNFKGNYVFTGDGTITAGGFVSIENLDMASINNRLKPVRGTNYDYGFDVIYQLGYAIKKQNADQGKNRELIVLFMSDGAANQFNYYHTSGGDSGSKIWDQWLEGTPKTEAEIKSLAACNDHWYYYDLTDHDNDGHINEHRMANAIKGTGNFEIIRKNVNNLNDVLTQNNVLTPVAGKENMYTVPGLGATMYTVAFDIAADGTIGRDAILHSLEQTPTSAAHYLEASNGDALKAAFTKIAGKIAEAATNVAVNDLIAPSYSMTFDFPANIDTSSVPNGHEFYIEVVNYPLNAQFERTGASESLIRVYMNEGGTFRAAHVTTAENGTETVTPVATKFEAKKDGEKGYFTSEGVYVPDGTGTHNITSGVYYSGTPSMDDDTNPANSLILVTPHFTYKAKGQVLDWTTDKLSKESQIALRYFVYLNGSADKVAGDASVEGQLPPGTYQTNTEATVSYINHLGRPCVQTFPVPQLSWAGAQVGVSFYLVNRAGQPINRSGEVVPLSAATFITKTFYESVIWNTDKLDPLRASYLAADHLPEGYMLYDTSASYMVHVYKDALKNDENGKIIHNFFQIGGSDTVANKGTTYVYNTINGQKYNAYGFYSASAKEGAEITYLVKNGNDYVETKSKVTVNTGDAIDYASTNVAFAVVWEPTLLEDTIVVDFGLPVAINVTQNDQLNNTIHAVGTGYDKSANVAMNNGWSKESILTGVMEGNTLVLPDGNRVTMYNGLLYFTQGDMIFDDPSVFYYDSQVSFLNPEPENEEDEDWIDGYMYSRVTVVPATTVYYEDSYVKLSSTVITYTPITLEEGFDDTVNYYVQKADGSYERVNKRYLKVGDTYFTREENALVGATGWEEAGEKLQNIVQGTDRPGDDKFHLTGYDADNIYGFDGAYDEYSNYSLGSAAKFTATPYKTGLATFEFYGTGFDVISVTSSNTGRMAVTVSKWVEGTGYERVKSYIVDTYYGYEYALCEVTYEFDGETWVRTVGEEAAEGATQTNPTFPTNPEKGKTVTVNEYALIVDKNAGVNDLYQIPVMKVAGLTYGKYKAEIQVSYSEMFDHKASTDPSYDFYLDAIRIYDPAGKTLDDLDDKTEEVYNKDGELLPEYHELRNWILDAESFKTAGVDASVTVDGAVFIDGIAQNKEISDYKNFGPNNEVYLAKKQSVAFKPNAAKAGYNANVHIAFKAVNGDAKVKISYVGDVKDGDTTKPGLIAFLEQDVKTATDLYFDITELNGKTVLIESTGDVGILSVTNIKYAYQVAVANNELDPYSGSGDAPISTNKADIDAVLSYLNMFIGEEFNEAEVEVTYEDEVAETEPEATEPEATEAEVEEPEATEPEATEAEVEETEATEPEATEAEDEEPESETIKLQLPESQMESAEAKTTATTPLQKIINNFTKVWSDIVTFFKNLF